MCSIHISSASPVPHPQILRGRCPPACTLPPGALVHTPAQHHSTHACSSPPVVQQAGWEHGTQRGTRHPHAGWLAQGSWSLSLLGCWFHLMAVWGESQSSSWLSGPLIGSLRAMETALSSPLGGGVCDRVLAEAPWSLRQFCRREDDRINWNELS
ncbi:sphingosine kinase 2 [Platysternon megacephalum]|uniref:Sphingosine kinase 2 n=1 Tax=Platysternon megacephalum TaxID=55544 RepID=A0A4D9DU63_9SAUR|nr:sphingosine kinase 2 [Platysternon megacephalum]